jgi:hypothetical protein
MRPGCAFYMNKAGTSFEADFAIRWEEPAKQFGTRHLLVYFTG